jgi:hypothetical protein
MGTPFEQMVMDTTSISAAYDKWRKITNSPFNANSRRRFFDFLNTHVHGVALGDDAMAKIKWLNSDDAETFYKIWEAQNGP